MGGWSYEYVESLPIDIFDVLVAKLNREHADPADRDPFDLEADASDFSRLEG